VPLSVGVDVIELDRVAAVIERWQEKFLDRVYTPDEQRYCRGRVAELAVRFAAKEAISKALGTGIRGLAWRDMEIVPDPAPWAVRVVAPQVGLVAVGRTLATERPSPVFSQSAATAAVTTDQAVPPAVSAPPVIETSHASMPLFPFRE
jgi:holo-[acyl-carrier protein] synthase